MHRFLSKSLAGGLSAGVVLLWWPLLFAADTVASWLIRGAVWTVCFELLLLVLGPLESALWNTRRGERLTRRAREAEARLHAGSDRRRLGRLTAMAVAGLAIPGALLAAGLHERAPERAEARPSKVVKVTRVVRPVTVRRVRRVVAAPVTAAALPAVPKDVVKAAPHAPHPASRRTVRAEAPRAPRQRGSQPVRPPVDDVGAPPERRSGPRNAAPANPAEPGACADCGGAPAPASGSSI